MRCIGDGVKPCRNCLNSQLECTYNAVPQKKGPKGHKAKVLSEIRHTQQHAHTRSPSVSQPENPLASPPALVRTAGLVSLETINDCVDYFFRYMYPTQPILYRRRVLELIGGMDDSAEAYCLITSLCAYMMIQPRTSLQQNAAVEGSGERRWSAYWGLQLLDESLRVRKSYSYAETPNSTSITTSFFYFASYFSLERHNVAWYHLREATTLALVIEMNSEASYANWDAIESSGARRLYWLLFVTERYGLVVKCRNGC